MIENGHLTWISAVLDNLPNAWLKLTTHRLDVYDEKQAKSQFLNHFEDLCKQGNLSQAALSELPTAYDYIRLGHPLSCILEWAIAREHDLKAEQVITFSSKTIPVMAILRRNALVKKNTRIVYTGSLPACFDAAKLREVYAYHFELQRVESMDEISSFDGVSVFYSSESKLGAEEFHPHIDFHLNIHSEIGAVLLAPGQVDDAFISDIQHVRRRETIAMTPANCHRALHLMVGRSEAGPEAAALKTSKTKVIHAITEITQAQDAALIASSGLSMQYAIMMGLVDAAAEQYPGKAIKFVVPPNCYGGTNDQARRVAACLEQVEVVDLPVDGDHDMIPSLEAVLEKIAQEDAIAYIIAEIPTNPRVEVPALMELKRVLTQQRKTSKGQVAVDPVFILDQTFCPNVHFLGEGKILSDMRAISYSSGSKFPSGGLCTAGYCVGNGLAKELIKKVEEHLIMCDNEAKGLQLEILAKQLPSMTKRIQEAYVNTRDFVTYIKEKLPSSKINFVSEELANQGFTPSVFSLDLPTVGETEEERETYKRALNLRLINMMIKEIPEESKYCVSYGQLKGCYWTIPATSTQGTTKEGDKDYIARVALSPDMDMQRHKEVFAAFAESIKKEVHTP